MKWVVFILLFVAWVSARRYYDPEIGRWISVDPAEQHFSPYTYGSNNPVNRIDIGGTLDFPVNNAQVSSGFSPSRVDPVTGVGSRPHVGVDVPVPVGTDIMALAKGTIVEVAEHRGYGTTIIVKHTDNTYSLYAHLSGANVKAGDVVAEGDVIALSGETGIGTAPHIHFEIMKFIGDAFSKLGFFKSPELTRIDPQTINIGEKSNKP